MNWLLFGATGVAVTNDPQAGDRMLSMLIYMACLHLPVVPLLFVGMQNRVYEAVMRQTGAKVVVVTTASLGIVGLFWIGIALPMVQTTLPATVVAIISMVIGLLTIRRAVKTYWADRYDVQDLVSKITPENKHDYSETDFGEPVGREKL